MILCSPTEPASLRAIGKVSRIPESWGADVVVPGARLVAIQRKTVDDLIDSLADGRLEREWALLRKAGCGTLLIEGRPTWTQEGYLEMSRRRFTMRQWWGVIWSSALVHGLQVIHTGSLRETVGCVDFLHTWLQKRDHRGLFTRPTANTTSEWGKATDRDWARHILQSFPGVGPTLADAIYDHFGHAPLAWSVGKDELAQVDGIGPLRLAGMWGALDRGQVGSAGGSQESDVAGGKGKAPRAGKKRKPRAAAS